MVEIERYQKIGICLDVPHEGLLRVAELQQRQLNRQNLLDLADLLFDQCGECNKMACLPQSAFAVHKLRKAQNDKDLAVARLSTDKQDAPRYMNNKCSCVQAEDFETYKTLSESLKKENEMLLLKNTELEAQNAKLLESLTTKLQEKPENRLSKPYTLRNNPGYKRINRCRSRKTKQVRAIAEKSNELHNN